MLWTFHCSIGVYQDFCSQCSSSLFHGRKTFLTFRQLADIDKDLEELFTLISILLKSQDLSKSGHSDQMGGIILDSVSEDVFLRNYNRSSINFSHRITTNQDFT